VTHPNIQVAAVFTHSLKPKSEDPRRSVRPEFGEIQRLAKSHNLPLLAIDRPGDEQIMRALSELGEFDFILSLSWRFLISRNVLDKAKIANINLHRGLLPQYAGAEPVRRMIRDGHNQATITAHIMEDLIDSGEILHEDRWPITIFEGENLESAVERIKRELDPIYPSTALQAMEKILSDKGLPSLEELR